MRRKHPFATVVDRPSPSAETPAAPALTPAQFWKLRSLLRDHQELAAKAEHAGQKAKAFMTELGVPEGFQFGMDDDTETITLLGPVGASPSTFPETT